MDVFAKRLREIQRERDMTQGGLARYLGMKAGTLANYMNDRKNPQIDTVAEMAEKLGVTIGWLCGDEEAYPRIKTYEQLSSIIDQIMELKFASVEMQIHRYSSSIMIEIKDDVLCEFYNMIEALNEGREIDEVRKTEFIKVLRKAKLGEVKLPM